MILESYLRKIPLFKQLKDAQLREVAARCSSTFCAKGRVLFRKTEMSTDLYIIKSGRLKAFLEDDEGDEIVLAEFSKGDFFGELSLLDGKGRSATILAEEDSELFKLNKSAFLEMLAKHPQIAIEVMITLVERLRKADERIESLAFEEVGQRLLRHLLESATQAGSDQEYLRTPKQTHRQLSARIGSSRESVSKCMKVLAEKQLIRDDDGHLLVARDALERFKTGGKISGK